MFINNRPAKEGEEEYGVITVKVKEGQFSAEMQLSHQPDITKGAEGISFVQMAAYVAFESVKKFADEAANQSQEPKP
jgi:hypothetical protein